MVTEELPYVCLQGFVIVRDYFTPEELQPCRDAVDNLVEELAQKLFKGGKIDSEFTMTFVFKETGNSFSWI